MAFEPVEPKLWSISFEQLRSYSAPEMTQIDTEVAVVTTTFLLHSRNIADITPSPNFTEVHGSVFAEVFRVWSQRKELPSRETLKSSYPSGEVANWTMFSLCPAGSSDLASSCLYSWFRA